MFAKVETEFAATARGVFAPMKEKIFADLNKHLKTVKGDVLEIGIGAGENFGFYPDGTSVIAVDSNPHVEELLKASLEKAGDRVRLKQFVAASAEKLDVADNSVAAVVCTLVMCSIPDDITRKTLREVKRVLMPGGRFYFLEHVAGKPWTFQYLIQQLVSKSLIWPTFCNECRCDRDTLARIEEVGFKTIQADKIWVDWTPGMLADCKAGTNSVWVTNLMLHFVNSMLFGFAEKREDIEKKKLLVHYCDGCRSFNQALNLLRFSTVDRIQKETQTQWIVKS
ncbi:hypothetical protein ACROYT_G020002 [Oculina patagonica]